MKRFLFLFFITLSGVSAMAQTNVPDRMEDSAYCHWLSKRFDAVRYKETLPCSPGWRYDSIYSDEFEGAAVNTNKWLIYNQYILLNNTNMGYMGDTAHVRIDNGKLVLNVTENTNGLTFVPWSIDTTFVPLFLSGGIRTHDRIRYGYLETECYLPKNCHYWPCFWTHANDDSIREYGEVDVFERTQSNKTDYPTVIRQNCYDDIDYDEWSSCTQVLDFPDSITGKTTVFGVEILPMELVFYVNGRVSSRLRYSPTDCNSWNTLTCTDIEELLPMRMRLSLNCQHAINEIPQPHEPAWFSYARCYKLVRGETDTFHPTNFVPSEESTKVYPHVILGGTGCTASVNTPTAIWAEQDIVFDKGFVLSSGTTFTARVIRVPDPAHSPLYIQNCHQQPQNTHP